MLRISLQRSAQHDNAISEMSSDASVANRRTEKRDAKQIARGLLTGAISLKDCQTKSGFALLRDSGFFALRFQFSELLRRQNSFGVTQKCLAASLRAACLHAFGLPGLNLSFLIGCEIQ